jgi:hypothetical protein
VYLNKHSSSHLLFVKENQSLPPNHYIHPHRLPHPVHIPLNMASSSIPSNVHVSTHPCLRAKLSLLRSKSTNARETKQLVHEIATIVGCEALAHGLQVTETGTVCCSPRCLISKLDMYIPKD